MNEPEEKRSEQKLTDAEKRYRALFDQAPLGILVVDPETTEFVEFNDAARQQLGYSKEEFAKLRIANIEAKTDEEIKARTSKMAKEGGGEFETKHYTKNGEARDVLVTTRAIELHGKTFLYAIYRDITDIRKTQDALIRSELQYRQLVDAAQEGVWAMDSSYRTVFVNPRMAAMLGCAQSEIVGKSLFEFLNKDAIEQFKNYLKKAEQNDNRQFEFAFSRKDGTQLDTSITASTIIDEQGQLIGTIALMADITERKRAERALKQSEELSRAIVANAPIGIATSDKRYHFLSANEAFCRTIGYTEDELRKLTFREITHPEEMQESIAKMSELVAGRISHLTLEKRYIKKDGKCIVARVIVSAIRNSKGEPVLFIAELEDITERKKMENELRQETEKLETIAESIGAGLTITSKDYRILWTNKIMKQFRGIPDLEGRLCYATYNYLNTVCPECGVKKVFEGKESDSREYTVYDREKGTTIWMQLIATPIKDKDGNVIAALELVLPITERKMMEQSLKGSEERFRTIMNSAFDAIIAVDDTMNIVAWNPAATRNFGYIQEEIIGKPISTLIPFNLTQTATQQIRKFFQTRQKDSIGNVIEAVGVKKDGTEFPVEVSFSKMQINGKNHGVAFVRDITERKQVQKKLQDYSKELEETVEQRTAELRATQERLLKTERLAAIGELAGMIGHDLRNPLAGIKNATYYLKKKGTSIPEDHAKQMLEIIDKAIDHADKIINDLLEYAREMHLELTESTLPTLLEAAVRMIYIPDRIQILNHVHEETKITVDADKIIRIFVNLIKNAIDAIPEKGTLEISSCQTKDAVRIAFADTGTGITEDTLQKIFTPLFTTKAQGMGFGLAICKRIIEAHGGTITVKTEVNKGTTFTIALPIKPIAEPESQKTWVSIPEPLLSTTTQTIRKTK
jgi:PAS domain S-box-containing protein